MARTVRIILLSLVLLGFAGPVTAGVDTGRWIFTTIDSAGATGEGNSLALIEGRPAISYSQRNDPPDGSRGTYKLKFAINSRRDGSGEWQIQTVDASGSVGDYTSLAEVDGRPAIAYYDLTNEDLKFAINTAEDASGEWRIQTVTSRGYVGRNPSLAVIDGRPAVAYEDWTGTGEKEGHRKIAIRYTINSEKDGSGTWRKQLIVESASSPSLLEFEDRPVFSFFGGAGGRWGDHDDESLRVAASSDADGLSSWDTFRVDSGRGVGAVNSLEEIGGRAAVAYLNIEETRLKFAVNSDSSDLSGWETRAVDFPGWIGTNVSLAEIGGKPVVVTDEWGYDQLVMAASSYPDGMGDWSLRNLRDTHWGGDEHSLVNLGGSPALTYIETAGPDSYANGKLVFAKRQ